jgi:hypothetical protein
VLNDENHSNKKIINQLNPRKMEWYIPITLLPGIALLILSTSNFIIATNVEIQILKEKKEIFKDIIKLKMKQLKRLNYAISGLYLSVLFFTISGLFASLDRSDDLTFTVISIGTTIMTLSVILLIIYSISANWIKRKHLLIDDSKK